MGLSIAPFSFSWLYREVHRPAPAVPMVLSSSGLGLRFLIPATRVQIPAGLLLFQFCRGMEQLVAREAHNLEVVGSSPTPATRH